MSQNLGRFNRGSGESLRKLETISREAPVLIAGPTASGKSSLAMELSARDGRIIVNADALQVYANWRVLTARPSPGDEAALPHALYGHVAPTEPYSVGHWLRELAPLLVKPVVLVGGTGLNFTALTRGLAEIPDTPREIRAEADARMVSEGAAALLSELDPSTTARIDRQNPARIQRAWEVQRATGRGLASWQDETPAPLVPRQRCEALVLVPDVEWLNLRIDRRFDAMLEAGALDEARSNLPGWNPRLPSSRAIGGPELIAFLKGETALDTAVAAAKLASRQYAKRQRTWFRSNMKSWKQVSLP
ncbi:MAG: tRNA (adenosine(37)-N6)-dimethylallyltransferase MiaA [Tabrizicola sp.]|nr:tRNA (adenosine(37)-N6)-dimethylallyltransferase MiaA [Tabrizicola sp.]